MYKILPVLVLMLVIMSGCGSANRANINSDFTQVQNQTRAIQDKGLRAIRANRCPSIYRAVRWARKTRISFALICRNKMSGYHPGRLSQSASTGKALMLLALVRSKRLNSSNRPVVDRMIRFSDNDAAHSIYGSLGDAPLQEAARRADMKSVGYCGCWSYINWSTADYARLFYSLPESLPRQNRWWAMRLLRDISPEQSWGIPKIARKRGYTVYFKGGWRPEVDGWIVLQGALVKNHNQNIALAIWTKRQPSLMAGASKIEHLTKLILASRAPGASQNDKIQPSRR